MKSSTLSSFNSFAKIFLINLGVLAFLLLILEISGQMMFKITQGQFPISSLIWESPCLFEAHPFLSVVPKRNESIKEGNKTITINEFGNRISSKDSISTPDPKKIRIVCLGGSTTFGVALGDEATYPYLLQEKLGEAFQVFNLGVPGYGTLEGIIQMTTLVSEIKPDYILLYQGWNDIQNYHLAENLPDYRAHGKMLQNALLKERHLSECFAITKFRNWICNRIRPQIKINYPDKPDLKVDSIYKKNLKTLATLGMQLGAKLIFIPQVLNVEHFQSTPGSMFWTANIENAQIPGWIRRFNKIMESSIPEHEKIQIIENILGNYHWAEEAFIDEGHFSKKGNEQFVSIILPLIKEKQLYSYQTE